MRTSLLALLSLMLVACPPPADDKPATDDTSDDSGGDPFEDEDGDGFLVSEGDCDDSDADINPGAAELCDDVDNDCDAEVDEGGSAIWYADSDDDGYGDPSASTTGCDAPAGYVSDATDCDDSSALFRPGAEESNCSDPADYNCDGSSGYSDLDGDGYAACAECDDGEPTINPGALEACNEIDDNCDGEVDDGAVDEGTFYLDRDGDGFGDDGDAVDACGAPAGYVSAGGDCDDDDGSYHPGAEESDCADPNDYNCDGSVAYEDADEDGWAACTDCDDSSATVNPDAPEACNDLDDDCDGSVDDDAADATAWYTDADLDGHGDPATAVVACTAPEDAVAVGGDCDDSSPLFHPGADESDCEDPSDYNCDGSVASADADGDGFAACEDCDDGAAAVNPAGVESCNGVDDDCDAVVDELDAVDLSTWFRDVDGDGHGDIGTSVAACDAPIGYVALGDDCDDASASYHPGADESDCSDPLDYNCDGSVAYSDLDADGFAACDDCDDSLAAVNPGATEACNDRDDDCDGTTDEPDATGVTTWYADADGDTFGDALSSTVSCDAPTAYVADGADCDDAVASTFPGAAERCDEVDQDCDGTTDEDAVDVEAFYADADGDSYGDAGVSVYACDAPSGYLSDGQDCDDTRAAVHPGATETCDDIDQDCDGTVDDGAVDGTTWYGDADHDGYGGTTTTIAACDVPSGYFATAADCDDLAATTHPGAPETCDGDDDDCDGATDEDAVDAGVWYLDMDGDGFGNAAVTVSACGAPSGYVANATDCADDDANTFPGSDELCDGDDNDCDGLVDEADAEDATSWYADADSDGYGNPAAAVTACDAPAGYGADATDCDDTSAAVSPAAIEVCNGYDDDCDGIVDEDAMLLASWFADGDGDGYGALESPRSACFQPSGYVASSTDCDDADATTYPDAPELCDSLDNDCDGTADEDATGTTWYADADEDGFGDPADAVASCTAPELFVADGTDCDDTRPGVNPAAEEVCENGLDDDCSGADECAYASVHDALTTAAATWTGINGSTSTSSFGNKIVGDHDFDGDGNADIAVGDRFYDASASSSAANMGRVTIFTGTGTGTGFSDTVADPTATLTGSDAAGRFGQGLAAGDLDGDGIDDLIVGVPGINGFGGGSSSLTDNGKAYVFLGPFARTGTTTTALTPTSSGAVDCSVEGAGATSYLGNSLAFGGDLDGDGGADWVYGAYQSHTSTGAGYVGIVTTPTCTGLLSSNTTDIHTIAGGAGDIFGLSVLGDLDLDGDGEDDLLVVGSGTDSVYAFLGPIDATTRDDADATLTSMDFVHSTSSPADLYGDRLASVGDTNGDGYDEFLVGANSYDVGTSTSAGAAFLFAGDTVLVAGSGAGADLADVLIYGNATTAQVGAGVSRAGDVDADGREDFIVGIGADTVDFVSYAVAALFYGGATGTYYPSLSAAPDGFALFNAEATNTSSGYGGGAAAAAGDVDGDGFDDILFANMNYGTTRVGKVYLVGGTAE
ncbi:MAG: putative metal-binding motif-containing protein [Pseudomonadota bacterium]|nr:putative metal-binding motif-containing protein [Pseudomonadota bacterium]